MKNYFPVIILTTISGIAGGLSNYFADPYSLLVKVVSVTTFTYAVKIGIKKYTEDKNVQKGQAASNKVS